MNPCISMCRVYVCVMLTVSYKQAKAVVLGGVKSVVLVALLYGANGVPMLVFGLTYIQLVQWLFQTKTKNFNSNQ